MSKVGRSALKKKSVAQRKTKIGKIVLKKKERVKAYRGELLPASVRRATVDFVKELKKHRIIYMIIGAVPVQFYGRERFSRDVDIALFLNEINSQNLLKILKSGRYKILYPLPHEHPIDKPEDLLNWHLIKLKDKETESPMDIMLKPPEGLVFDSETMSRARKVTLNGVKILIPSPEDYLITKLKSKRPYKPDFGDIISTLTNLYDSLDWEYLEERARKFGVAHLLGYYKEGIESKRKRL